MHTIEELGQAVAVSAKNWVSPSSIQVTRYAEIACADPVQVISRPLSAGAEIPDEGDIIYFSSQDMSIPAFVCEEDFNTYCTAHGLDEMASDGVFSSCTYHVTGKTHGGDEVFLGEFGSPAQVEDVRTAFTAPVQAMLDTGLIANFESTTAGECDAHSDDHRDADSHPPT